MTTLPNKNSVPSQSHSKKVFCQNSYYVETASNAVEPCQADTVLELLEEDEVETRSVQTYLILLDYFIKNPRY